MTLAEALRALGRQWVLLFVGLVATVVAAHHVVDNREVYWTQTTVRFVPSAEQPGIGGNNLVTSSDDLIAFAGLVLTDLDLGDQIEVASLGPNILDVGVDDGIWVRLPDNGGQWANNFEEAFLDVQVSGQDPDEVRRRTSGVVNDIRVAALRRQEADAKSPGVLVRPTPATPVIAAAGGATNIALVGTIALGEAASVALALGVDGFVVRRRRR